MQGDDPWKAFQLEYHRGEKLRVPISDVVHDIGLFVGLPGGIWGIIHLNDLDAPESGRHSLEQYSVGDEVEAIILSINVELQRVSMGIKQLSDPDSPLELPGDPPAPTPIGPRPPRNSDSSASAIELPGPEEDRSVGR